MLLLVGAAAAGAVVHVESASGEVAVDAEADSGDAPASRAAGNETNETNETPPPPPPPPSNNTTMPRAPILSPDHQNVSGNGNGTTFAMMVKNPATTRQTIALAAQAPQLWTVTLSDTNVTLGPGQSHSFTGTIRVAHGLGGTGTVYVTATGAGGADNATVHACIRGLLQACPSPNGTSPPPPNGTRPPTNETPPPGNGSNGTRPPTNETPPPGNGTNGTRPPGNSTPQGNGTSGASYPASPPAIVPPVDATGGYLIGLPRATGGALRPELGGV